MKYTPEQRHQLEKEFVVKLANFDGWNVDPNTVHVSQDPKVQQCLELSRKLIGEVEKAITPPKVSDNLLPVLGDVLQLPQHLNN